MSESIQSGALRASSFDRPEGAYWAGNFLRKVRYFQVGRRGPAAPILF